MFSRITRAITGGLTSGLLGAKLSSALISHNQVHPPKPSFPQEKNTLDKLLEDSARTREVYAEPKGSFAEPRPRVTYKFCATVLGRAVYTTENCSCRGVTRAFIRVVAEVEPEQLSDSPVISSHGVISTAKENDPEDIRHMTVCPEGQLPVFIGGVFLGTVLPCALAKNLATSAYPGRNFLQAWERTPPIALHIDEKKV